MKARDFLPRTDLSEFLETEKLMDAWYMLSNENISILIDAVKPRIYRVFVHGLLGTLQQLSYDTDSEGYYHAGLWGIVPTYYVGDKRFFPFIRGTMTEDNHPERIVFNAKEKMIELLGTRCFGEDGKLGGLMDMKAFLVGNRLDLHMRYPKDAERAEVYSGWYPLYTEYKGAVDAEYKPVEYFQYGFLGLHIPKFEMKMGENLTLVDRYGRLPKLRVSSRDGECWLISHTDKNKGNAFRLEVSVRGPAGECDISYEFMPNPVTIKVRPIFPAKQMEHVEIYAEEKPKLELDGKDVLVTKKDGRYEAQVSLEEGKHTLTASNSLGKSRRFVYAIPSDPIPKILKMGEAVARLPWKNPPIKNIPPYFYYLDSLGPAGRADTEYGGASYCSHGVRVFPILVTASFITGDRKYVDRALECLEALAEKAHGYPDGDLALPHQLDMNGNPYPTLLDALRPSDNCIIVRALLYTYQGFNHFGDKAKARRCLDLAYRFAHTLTKMQEPDGSFYARYRYPTLKRIKGGEGKGTVNNWAIQLWELAKLYKDIDTEKAHALENIVLRYVNYLLEKKPSILRVPSTGAEAAGFHYESLSTNSLYLLIKFLSSGEEKYAEYAKESFKMAALITNLFIDQPQNYFFPSEVNLGPWFDQPALVSKGGMADLTLDETGLFLKKYLNYEFGEFVSSYNFADRLAGSILDNGAVIGVIVEAPNYFYRREDAAETLNYGGVGVYAYYYVKRKLKI